jgi:threonine aldolase
MPQRQRDTSPTARRHQGSDVQPVINLRSDTQTLPTARMRQAMATAELGDETYGEDPTVRRFEAMAAERFGTEAALLLLSGTMANLVALLVHCRPADEVFVDGGAHVVYYESGGLAAVAGVTPTFVASDRGHILPDALHDAIRRPNIHYPRPRLVWLENTHNRGAGSVMRLDHQRAVEAVARERGLAVHLDGARVLNAAAAQGLDPRALVAGVDSAMVDLTKGLACPMGALLLGSREFVDEARFRRRLVGGGMRQAGVIAACGIVAFEDLFDRAAEDHESARAFAERIARIPGFRIDPGAVETNMLYVDVSDLGSSTAVVANLRAAGVLVSDRPPTEIRIVTHLQLTPALLDEAASRLEAVASAGGSSMPAG